MMGDKTLKLIIVSVSILYFYLCVFNLILYF